MKTKLAKTALLLAIFALLPLVQGCYGDKVNVAAAWVPADLQGIVIVAGGNGTAAATGAASSSTSSTTSGGGGGYLP